MPWVLSPVTPDILLAGVSKTKSVSVSLEPGCRQASTELTVSCDGQPDFTCRVSLPATVWLVPTSQQTESFAELLLSGSLAFMQAKQLVRETDNFPAIISSLVGGTNIALVDQQETTASLYAESSDGSRLAFLVKVVTAGLSLEGRGEDKELLAGVLEVVSSLI